MEKRSKFTYRQLSHLTKYSVDTPLRVIAHIDLDAFYAQVEVKRLNLPPSEPLAVQQWQNLIAVNYAARAHGVTRHETAVDALKRCPTLKLVHVATWRSGDVHWSYSDSPNISMHKACLDPYRIESKKILAVFRSACPRVEKASIDESFLDLSAMVHEVLLERYPELTLPAPYGDPSEMLPLPPAKELEWVGSCVLDKEEEAEEEGGEVLDWDDVVMAVAAEIVQRVRERVRVEIGYTCSAGIAGNKMLAKLGSGYKKPNSQTVVRPGAIQKFLNTLEFTKIRNLGGKLGSQISAAFNTSSLSALIEIPLPQLHAKLPAEDATWLYNTIRGIDKSDVNPRTAIKSMLSAKSFRPPITSPEQALKWLRVFVADLHSRLIDEEGVQEGKRRPTSMTMMHRGTKPGSQKTRQVAMTARIELDAMLAQAESLLKGMVAEGGAYPCAGLSLQVGGFEEKESGNRGIAGFLVRKQPGEPSVAVEREPKRRRVEEEGIGRYIRRVDKEDDLDRDLEEEPPVPSPQQSPSPIPPVENESPQNDPPPPAIPPSPSPPPPTPPPQETYTYACAQCNFSIPLEGREEHEDWHFAKSLAEQDKAAARERIAAARAEKASPPTPAPAKNTKKGPKKGGGGGGGGGGKKGGGGLEKGQSKLAFGKS